MKILTIQGQSPESARGLVTALLGFKPELLELEDGSYSVAVTLGTDKAIVAGLDALKQYVTARGNGPARLELEGHTYTMHPEAA